jgi:hypothetical protein
MLFKQLVGNGNMLLVPPVIPCLASTDQKQGDPSRVKSIQDPVRFTLVLDS